MATVISSCRLVWRKTANGQVLHFDGKGHALATIEPDVKYAGMWRVHMPDGWVSDMARLEWAKEGAIRSVLFVLNRQQTRAPGSGLRETTHPQPPHTPVEENALKVRSREQANEYARRTSRGAAL